MLHVLLQTKEINISHCFCSFFLHTILLNILLKINKRTFFHDAVLKIKNKNLASVLDN